ncbi:tetratricopeptide repeat-containing sulfotransferase family protein [Cognatiluteimonas weifangensis]|uniref:Sulfotransferase n=1 Tax=Cognatiluteimonas weifangensis TaxID=2303539 RepID=A0A372DMP0_9GAMM|nr:sulfotransferase [Luteimonas weifangensis]RFP60830.1 sulfotransferase [Luteimonas weifangensis]
MSTPISQSDDLLRWHEAQRLFAAGQSDAAAAIYRQLFHNRQLAPAAHLQLSLLAGTKRRYRDAVDEAMAAFETRIAEPDLLQGLARRLAYLGESQAMLTCASDPSILRGSNVPVLAELGRMLANAYFPDDALQLLEGARARGFRNPTLDYLIGLCRMYAGDDEVAERELESSLRGNPDSVPALRALTRLRRRPGDGDGCVERLQAVLGRIGKEHADAPMLLYALFAELDRRDEIEPAWQVLAEGMRLRRSQVRYDSAAEQALFDYLGALKPAPTRGHVDDGPRPVFIVGMPRSGTTLLERILGNHPEVADAGELRDLVRQLRWMCDLGGASHLDLPLAQRAEAIDFAELGRRYLAHTQWRARGRAVYTDKMPPNFLNVSYIARALPQARILHMVRGPMDTCFSNLKEWFAGAYPHSYDQTEMADHYRRYRTLMAHWRALYPGRILDVRYDELVTEPEKVVREVLAFCDLPWHEGMTAIEERTGTVATASAAQVREPIHQRFLEQWRRYENHLGPLRERLGALAY